MILWREMQYEQPEDYQECLFHCGDNRGIFQGTWDPRNGGYGIDWHEGGWTVQRWIPIEEAQ